MELHQIKKGLVLFFLAILMLVGLTNNAHATHLRAGNITVVRDNCNALTFTIIIEIYTDTSRPNPVLVGGNSGMDDILDFGDGTFIQIPEQPNGTKQGLPDNVGYVRVERTHTYGGPGKYVISYREPNRNELVLNMDNSVQTRFYIETLIDIDPFKGCNNSPKMDIPPIDEACPGVAFFHNPGAFDPDGDSLSYEMVIPFSDRSVTVVNYRDPNAPSFYTNYNSANEEGNGQPTFLIDPITGTIKWDSPSPSAIGEYNIAFIVKEWRKIRGVWYQIGFVRRDMQIVVKDCDNERPDLIIPMDTCIEAGTQLRTTILGIDPENQDVKIEAFSEIFNLAAAQSPATYTPYPPDFLPSNPPAELEFEWNTTCDHIKAQPYQVVFKITDNPSNGPKLVTFKTWNITVVAPAPEWNSAVLDLPTRSAQLEWDSYACSNATTMQIWRRVDSFIYDPENCETGMPAFMGYELIDEIPLKDLNNNPVTTYLDNNGGKGLAPGAIFCYRLVAEFPLPKGGESYISNEICVGPIEADAPVITEVTVEKTGIGDGEIIVSWVEPYDATSFPPPYSYEVWRGVGFSGAPATKIHTGRISVLTATDVGLNTEVEPYNYYVIAFDANDVVVDTSAVASSVWLDAKPELDNIKLNWTAFVPWSNRSQSHPRHLIYRSTTGTTEADMVLYDSVDVNLNGFVYVDDGKGVPMEEGINYCYRVMTRGVYGNDPTIPEPLENFSQIVCTPLTDPDPPCKPEPPAPYDHPECDNYEDALNFDCNQNVFSNQINWNRPDDVACLNDIVSYNVYVSSVKGGTFVLRQTNVRDTFYVDVNLPSYARCYKIAAVDRSGNESELSDAICIDNCPYYELPNVFSPNGDGCNDLFSAYSDDDYVGEDGGLDCQISEDNKKRCARFVRSVHFRVYNRWGKEVYNYESGGERTIYIDWDGRTDNGKELSTGVYYFVADVVFETVDPDKSGKTIKGWVQILR